MKVKVKLGKQLRAGFCLQRLDAKRVAVIGLDRKATVVLLGQIIDRNEGSIQDKIYDIAVGAEGAAVDVVSSPGGTIKKVVQHSTEAGAGGYPTTLKTVNGTITAELKSTGFETSNSSGGAIATVAPDSIEVSKSGKTATLDPVTGLTLDNGTHTLVADLAALTQNMTIREIDVCDSGVAKKMLVIGSAPYV